MKIYHLISAAMFVATTTADTQNQKLRGAGARLLVGPSSCTGGNNECKDNEGTIGNEACQGDYDGVDDLLGVCQFNKGTIQDHACKGSGVSLSCSENKGEIGYSACHGKDVCRDNKEGATIGMAACAGDNTCSGNSGDIGFAACFGRDACNNNSGTIGTEACIGNDACNNNSGTIEPGCCTENNWIPECDGNSGLINKIPGSDDKCEYEHGLKKPGEACVRFDRCRGYRGEECDQQNDCMRGYACEKPRSTGSWTYAAPQVCCKSSETVGFLTYYGWAFFCKEW